MVGGRARRPEWKDAEEERPNVSVLFPKWMNALPTIGAIVGVGGLTAAVWGYWYWITPEFWRVGYMPTQPGGGFNHQIHVSKLGMDCRYCHTKVEVSAEANIPNVATCYGCHAPQRLDAFNKSPLHREKTDFIRVAYDKDESIPWLRVHKTPDYVRNFPHAPHIAAGVSCYSCHGQIAGMPVVFHAKGLGMAFCLDCHRGVETTPEKYLVPKDRVTDLIWVENTWMANQRQNRAEAQRLLETLTYSPPQNCGACHH